MREHLVESLRGIGDIHVRDRLVRTTRYELSVWSSDDRGDAIERIDGHIDITGIQEAVVLAGPESLILTVEDGRRIAFRLTSSLGAITAPRWLP
jgi:hypothetical protein